MTVDTTLIVAEMRARELFYTLIGALNGNPHWRARAAKLVREIEEHELPEQVAEHLREVDERKRAAEIMQDLVNG